MFVIAGQRAVQAEKNKGTGVLLRNNSVVDSSR